MGFRVETVGVKGLCYNSSVWESVLRSSRVTLDDLRGVFPGRQIRRADIAESRILTEG